MPPRRRGQSPQHGATMCNAVDGLREAWARGVGLLRLELTVMAHNRRARRLYERHGYLMEGIKRGAIRVRGEPVDEVLMGKSLDALTTP